MPIYVTKQSFDVLGINPGTVEPLDLSTTFAPFILPDWSSPIIVSTEWMTSISVSPITGTEERISLQSRPTRTLSFVSSIINQETGFQTQMTLNRMMSHEIPFPLYSDQIFLTAPATSSDTVLQCDSTVFKRLYLGQRLMIAKRDHNRFVVAGTAKAPVLYGIVKDITADTITLEDPVGVDLEGNEIVYPCFDSLPILSSVIDLETDFFGNSRITVLEKSGSNTLPPTWIGEVDTWMDYYKGYPIFKIEPNYNTKVRQTHVRQGVKTGVGRGTVIDLYGELPDIQIKYTELSVSRREAWDMLRFFDSRRGTALPFWVIQPQTAWKFEGNTSTSVDISNTDFLDSINTYIKEIGIEDSTGKQYIRTVTSTSATLESFTLNFNESLPEGIIIKRVTPAWLCRFGMDELSQSWQTDHIEFSDVNIIGIRSERESKIT